MTQQEVDSHSPDVLLIEDSDADEKLFLSVLRLCGHDLKVHTARDGAEALEYLSKAAIPEHGEIKVFPKLIVLDLKMPRVDGFQFLQHIKCHSLLRIIPIVVLTSSCHEQDIHRCYQLGANAYLVKPVDFSTYAELVKNTCAFWLYNNRIPEMLSEHIRTAVGNYGLWLGR